MRTLVRFAIFFPVAFLFQLAAFTYAQSGNAGTISGTITDPSGAVIPGATITILDPVSQYSRTAITDRSGHYQFPNVPFNSYHLTVAKTGFASAVQDIDVRSVVVVHASFALQVGNASSTVTVEAAGDLIENDPTFHTDVDRDLFIKVPLESQSSTLSSLVTLTTPGVAQTRTASFMAWATTHRTRSPLMVNRSPTNRARSSQTSFPRTLSNPWRSSAELHRRNMADKTSLVIVATTRSGQGITKPTGQINAPTAPLDRRPAGFDLSYGGKKLGQLRRGRRSEYGTVSRSAGIHRLS